MEQYTVEQFLEDVKKEARALRENATKEEIGLLDREEFDPSDLNNCIYGQMTGDCQSERAAELIHLCCPRYFENNQNIVYESIEGPLSETNVEKIAGIDSAAELRDCRTGWLTYLSAVEAYIMTPEANTEGLISYLKGESDTLEL